MAFLATVTNTNIEVGEKEAVKYNHVLNNLGGGYNHRTGHFTAPYSGIYTISASVMSQPSNNMHFKIVKNGQMLSMLYSANDTYPLASHTLNLPLTTGDQIWVERHTGRQLHSHGYGPYNIFSGALINVL